MCGIAAIFSSKTDGLAPSFELNSRVTSMIKTIRHRGPDALDTKVSNNCAFGHARLSIIDLDSRSNQPMISFDGRYKLIFNGEIYNYMELKKSLKNYRFQTKSDSEVILAAYSKWGTKCLNYFNGMFAFIIYDMKYDQIFVARDRFGIKPLFWTKRKNEYLFASEAKAILTQISIKPNINYFKRYLINGEKINGSETCFADIKQLLPGEYFIINKSYFKKIRYYNIGEKIRGDDFESQSDDSIDAEETFTENFISAVDFRTRADVPISVNFSGGSDSSAILSVLGKHLKKFDVLVNSAVSVNVSKSDKNYIENIAHQCGYKVNYCNTDESKIIKDLDLKNMMWHSESPFLLSHYLDKCLAYRSKNLGYIVILDGNGADEHLLGYKEHMYPVITDFYFKKKYDCALSLFFLSNKRHNLYQQILSPYSILKTLFKNRGYLDKKTSWLKEVTANFFEYKLQSLLWFRDRSSMAHSTELRVPFLDHNLVESMLSLPIIDRINKNGQKDILKKFLNKNFDNINFKLLKNSFLKPQLPLSIKKNANEKFKLLSKKSKTQAQEIFDFASDKVKISKESKYRISQIELWYETFYH